MPLLGDGEYSGERGPSGEPEGPFHQRPFIPISANVEQSIQR